MFEKPWRCPDCHHTEPDRCVCGKDPALKGIKGGNCNRTACQQPEAHYLNVGTNAYYCWECAVDINEFAMRDHADGTKMNLFPTLVQGRAEQIEKRLGSVKQVARSVEKMLLFAERYGAGLTRLSKVDEWPWPEPARQPKQKAQWKRERNGRP